MKAVVLGALMVAVAAGSASAVTLVGGSSTGFVGRVDSYAPLTDAYLPQTRASNTTVFSALSPNSNNQFSGFAAAAGPLGFDDYNSTLAGGNAFLQGFQFIGGLTAAGTINVQFFNTAGDFVNNFTVNLPAGPNIWNIGLETVAGAKDSTFLIPEAGYVQIDAVGLVTGQWFLATPAPTIGTESRAAGEGSITSHSHRFALTVPAPSAMALLGMGGLLAARRRR